MCSVSTVIRTAHDVPRTWPRWWLRIRWALLAAAVVMLVVAVATGDRSGSLADLESDLAAGNVDTVTVVGTGLADGSTGYARQEVHWRDGLVERRAEVWHVTPGESPQTDGEPVSRTEIGRTLADEHPGLTVLRREGPEAHSELAGWRLTGWAAVGAFVLLGAALSLLINGPQPWRATRWAWFWLLWTPAGFVAFLLLAGPLPLVPGPRRPGRRLTGGWAFLLSLVLGGGILAGS